MKRILFLGTCEKHDLLLYVGKILRHADLKVLVVDATRSQKYRYSISAFDSASTLIEYDGIDVATGFLSYEALSEGMKQKDEVLEAYDMILIDTDEPDYVEGWMDSEMQALVSSFERYAVLRNIRLLERYFERRKQQPARFTSIFYPYQECQIDGEYVIGLLQHLPIEWAEDTYDFWPDEVDDSIRISNQYDSRIRLKGLSRRTKRLLMQAAQAFAELPAKEAKLALKRAERGK